MKISHSSSINTYKQIGLLKRCLEQSLEHRKTFAILEIDGKVASGIFLRHVKPLEVTRYSSLVKNGGKFDHYSCCRLPL